jgi:hypothetical protein
MPFNKPSSDSAVTPIQRFGTALTILAEILSASGFNYYHDIIIIIIIIIILRHTTGNPLFTMQINENHKFPLNFGLHKFVS